ncbi:MAG: DEAD/DEAH box helicase family protein [Anaerolineae bacterium]|nr:DEAD/DEAH box helicase family protein [Anaerolineae bacterium]
MMYLKKYQQRVASEFEHFFNVSRAKKDALLSVLANLENLPLPVEAKKSLMGMNWVEQTFNEVGRPYIDHCSNGLGQKYPRAVLKIPTGGGKTLLAVEAIRAYQTLFARRRTGLVVWVVPSETIYSQTVQQLRDKRNHLRQLLDQCSGNRTLILEKGQRLTAQDISENLVILFVMIQSISRSNAKEALKVFQDAGGYESFFPADNRFDLHQALLDQYPNLDTIAPAGSAFTLVKTSLGNAIRVSQPFIIIDEIHKVFSDMARHTIDSLNPEMVLGLSATPRHEMNILISVSGLELKAEEMVKLDMHIFPPASQQEADWQSMVGEICQFRDGLEEKAVLYRRQTGIYIRPIALIQCEATGRDQRGRGRVHSLDVKEYLISRNINPSEIAIKTSAQNDIEDVDLLSEDCPVRYIITKEALREGWDCPFAYVLGIIPNVNSDTGVTQLIGRILRQPYVKKTGVRELDESYVFYSRGGTQIMVQRVAQGFQVEGLEDLVTAVQVKDTGVNATKTVKIKESYALQYPQSLFLPVWVMVVEGGIGRRFSYDIDIKSRLDFSAVTPTGQQIDQIGGSFSQQSHERTAYVMSLGEHSEVVVRNESAGVVTDSGLNIGYLTRLYSDVVENPFLAHHLAVNHLAILTQNFSQDVVERNFGIAASLLAQFLLEEKRRQEESVFIGLIRSQELVLAVSDDPITGYSVPQTDEIVISREPNAYKYYLFDDVEVSSMNSLERSVGDILDRQERILWWFRNKVSRSWYSIQGWRKYAIHPDFVAAKKTPDGRLEIVYVLESKGEQLLGNLDTQYKKKVFEAMTEYHRKVGIRRYQQLSLFGDTPINTVIECYLIEQGQEESSIRTLMN